MSKQKLLVVLILLPVVCSLFFSVGSVSAYDLELDDYAHYKVIAYEAGVGAGTDYQVVVVVHYGTGTDGTMSLNGETVALLHVGDIQADFDDVRFANQFGELLTYKRCSYTSAVNATFVVKVEANLDVDQLVYVYFGNLAAVDASSDNALVDVISGVVGAWDMSETAGANVADSSGNGNDGTATGTTIVDSNFTGKKARQLTGNPDTIVFGNVHANTLAVSAWLKRNGTQGDYTPIINQANFDNNPPYYEWCLGFQEGNKLRFGVSIGGVSNPFCVATDAMTDAVWIHAVGVYDGANVSLYVNGNSVGAAQARTGVIDNIAQNMQIGVWQFGAAYFNGYVSNVNIFTGLTQGQITNLQSGYPDSTLVAGSVLVRKWATTTLPAVAGVSDAVDNSAFSAVVDGALTDTEWFISGLLLVLALANVVLLAFPFALLRFVFGVLSFALSAWAFTYSGLPLAPYLQVMGLVVSVVCMFLATRARE